MGALRRRTLTTMCDRRQAVDAWSRGKTVCLRAATAVGCARPSCRHAAGQAVDEFQASHSGHIPAVGTRILILDQLTGEAARRSDRLRRSSRGPECIASCGSSVRAGACCCVGNSECSLVCGKADGRVRDRCCRCGVQRWSACAGQASRTARSRVRRRAGPPFLSEDPRECAPSRGTQDHDRCR